jgi:hypothetical protein
MNIILFKFSNFLPSLLKCESLLLPFMLQFVNVSMFLGLNTNGRKTEKKSLCRWAQNEPMHQPESVPPVIKTNGPKGPAHTDNLSKQNG